MVRSTVVDDFVFAFLPLVLVGDFALRLVDDWKVLSSGFAAETSFIPMVFATEDEKYSDVTFDGADRVDDLGGCFCEKAADIGIEVMKVVVVVLIVPSSSDRVTKLGAQEEVLPTRSRLMESVRESKGVRRSKLGLMRGMEGGWEWG